MDIDKEILELKKFFDSYQGPYVDFRSENEVILDGSFDLDDLIRVISILSAQQRVQQTGTVVIPCVHCLGKGCEHCNDGILHIPPSS